MLEIDISKRDRHVHVFQVSSTRVQASLITDDSVSYAVFAYECDFYTSSYTSSFNDGDIGWADIPSLYYKDWFYCSRYLCSNTIIYRLDRSESVVIISY